MGTLIYWKAVISNKEGLLIGKKGKRSEYHSLRGPRGVVNSVPLLLIPAPAPVTASTITTYILFPFRPVMVNSVLTLLLENYRMINLSQNVASDVEETSDEYKGNNLLRILRRISKSRV